MRVLSFFLIAGILAAQPPAPAPSPNANAAPESKSAADNAAKSAGPRPLKSIGTMKEIMLDYIFPTSNELFYVGRNEEKTEKDWNDLRQNILIMAEGANLLMAENRARDNDRWMKDALLLWDVGNRAYKLVKAKDLEGLKALNDDLYEACQSCHEHYRPGYKRRL
jgi:hypothetical protein